MNITTATSTVYNIGYDGYALAECRWVLQKQAPDACLPAPAFS